MDINLNHYKTLDHHSVDIEADPKILRVVTKETSPYETHKQMAVKTTTFDNDVIQKSSSDFFAFQPNNRYAIQHPKLIPKLKHLSISDSKKTKPHGFGLRGNASAIRNPESLVDQSFYSSVKNSNSNFKSTMAKKQQIQKKRNQGNSALTLDDILYTDFDKKAEYLNEYIPSPRKQSPSQSQYFGQVAQESKSKNIINKSLVSIQSFSKLGRVDDSIAALSVAK